jgi:N-acetylneuraminate synthase
MLYVFEMANNHQGSVAHGKLIIKEFGELAAKNNITAAIKFQFRQLDTFIHTDFQQSDLKYVKRFNSTRLSKQQFAELIDFAKTMGLKTMATPFDNESLVWFNELDVDIVKIASCSVDDWPLLRSVAKIDRRIIISTAGADFDTVDKVYDLFKNNSRDISFMHCVGDYPTAIENSNLNRIKEMLKRYNVEIGISTHESPDQETVVPYAVAIGCKIIEKHVGVQTDVISLNAYSCQSSDMQKVIDKVKVSESAMTGTSQTEKSSLRNLKRGIYLKRVLQLNSSIEDTDVYYSMPLQPGQASVAEIDNVVGKPVERAMNKDSPVNLVDCYSRIQIKIMQEVKSYVVSICSTANIAFNENERMEISAHYGLEKFDSLGCTILNRVNREYCKKLLIMKPGQSHPVHHHVLKEEAFELLYGDCILKLNGKDIPMERGKPIVIARGVNHSFRSEKGCIVEEISTTHHKGDSVYEDPNISKLKLSERKYFV